MYDGSQSRCGYIYALLNTELYYKLVESISSSLSWLFKFNVKYSNSSIYPLWNTDLNHLNMMRGM